MDIFYAEEKPPVDFLGAPINLLKLLRRLKFPPCGKPKLTIQSTLRRLNLHPSKSPPPLLSVHRPLRQLNFFHHSRGPVLASRPQKIQKHLHFGRRLHLNLQNLPPKLKILLTATKPQEYLQCLWGIETAFDQQKSPPEPAGILEEIKPPLVQQEAPVQPP